MAKIATFPTPILKPRSAVRGLKQRSTRFANDVHDFCVWYQKHRGQQGKVTEYVEWLQKRARRAGSTRP